MVFDIDEDRGCPLRRYRRELPRKRNSRKVCPCRGMDKRGLEKATDATK